MFCQRILTEQPSSIINYQPDLSKTAYRQQRVLLGSTVQPKVNEVASRSNNMKRSMQQHRSKSRHRSVRKSSHTKGLLSQSKNESSLSQISHSSLLQTARPFHHLKSTLTTARSTIFNQKLKPDVEIEEKDHHPTVQSIEQMKKQFIQTFERCQKQIQPTSRDQSQKSTLQSKVPDKKLKTISKDSESSKSSWAEVRNFVEKMIDPIGQILNEVANITTKNKIPFRCTMFLMYKVLWLRRRDLFKALSADTTEKKLIDQLQAENGQVERCLTLMLEKLRQSKRWKQNTQKQLLEDLALKGQPKQMTINLSTRESIRDYQRISSCKLGKEEDKTLVKFGQAIIVQIYDYLPPKMKTSFKKYNSLESYSTTESEMRSKLNELLSHIGD